MRRRDTSQTPQNRLPRNLNARYTPPALPWRESASSGARRREVRAIDRRRLPLHFAAAAAAALTGCSQLHPPAVEAGPAASRPALKADPIATTAPPSVAAPASLNVPSPTDAVKDEPEGLPTAKKLADRAVEFCKRTPNFTCWLTRQERLGSLQPKEKVLIHARVNPRSCYYKWLGEACAGRECIWVQNQNNGEIITRGGKGDFLYAGKRISLSPDNLMVKSRSRYAIYEANFDQLAERLKDGVEKQMSGDSSAGTFAYVGRTEREEIKGPAATVRQVIPAKLDPRFPNGGVRFWYFDDESGRVLLVYANDPKGDLLEYYFFEHLIPNNTLSDNDFNPDAVWSPVKAGTAASPPK